MNKKILVATLGIIVFAMLISVARAAITVWIDVRDSNGVSVKNATLDLNTVVTVHGYYEDNNGRLPATAKMEVYFDDGTGKTLDTILYFGNVNSGTEIIRSYTMTKIGTYEFKWECTKGGSTIKTASFSTQCRIEKGLDLTSVFVVPEPATIAGLLMALTAFGLLAYKRSKKQ
jgi:hypothetical protein